MDWLNRLKNIGFRLAIKQLNEQSFVHTCISFDKAKTIGILFDASVTDNKRAVLETANYLHGKGKSVEILAYIDDKKAEPQDGFQIFTPKELNFWEVPKSETISQFCHKEFDILLCPIIEENRPLSYVSMTSKARCRVGIFHLHKPNNFELMVMLNEELPMLNILAQMLRLLQQLKTSN